MKNIDQELDNQSENNAKPHIGLFATCLVDLVRPSIGFATVELLKAAGCKITVPELQTCCGQPAYNAGDNDAARQLAHQMIKEFENFDYVIVPSGSCGGMIKHHYVKLCANDPVWLPRAEVLSNKTFELTQFLDLKKDQLKTSKKIDKTITYHDSCAGLREMGIKQQPRDLLNRINQVQLIEGVEAETCCGFGGLFCVKYPEISTQMTDAKIDDLISTGAEMVVGGDLGCLMTIAGRLKRRKIDIEVRHVAEVLTNMMDIPPIADVLKQRKSRDS